MFSFTNVVLHREIYNLRSLQYSKNMADQQGNDIGSDEDANVVLEEE